MGPEDELCLCFHVTRRKVENYLRVEKPRAPSQLADCYGAGTGCGWCRPLLGRLFAAAQAGAPHGGAEADVDLPDAQSHALGRAAYVRSGGAFPHTALRPFPMDALEASRSGQQARRKLQPP